MVSVRNALNYCVVFRRYRVYISVLIKDSCNMILLEACAHYRKAPVSFVMSVPPFARLSAYISSAPSGRISLKFGYCGRLWNLCRGNTNLVKIGRKMKWSEVKWVTVQFLGTRVPCTLGWPYTEVTCMYCDYFIWSFSCTVVVLTCYVMCGCFGNMCTCIYCVLYCLYCVFCVVFTVFLYCFFYVYLF